MTKLCWGTLFGGEITQKRRKLSKFEACISKHIRKDENYVIRKEQLWLTDPGIAAKEVNDVWFRTPSKHNLETPLSQPWGC